MAFSLREALVATSAIGLAISLAACGPDDDVSKYNGKLALGDVSGPFSWPMDDYDELRDRLPADVYGDWAPLGAARPMVARVTRPSAARAYAPAWDYPESYRYDEPQFASYGAGYYDEAYYESPYFERAYYGPAGYDWYDRSPDPESFALLALAAVLGSVIGNSPPDYYFDYDRVQPWVWVTEDHYVRYAEPLRSGYRYYYYAPDAPRPFLVRDPLYTYGYSGDRLVVIYDSYGRVLNRDRAVRLRRAASSYYDRGVTLYRAGISGERYGVAAPLWQQRSADIVADQQVWNRARNWSPGWQHWNKRYDKAVKNHWKRERIARTYAANRFEIWQENEFRGDAPRPRRELRMNRNPHKAALQQAVVQTRRQDRVRSARMERTRNETRFDRSGPMLRRALQNADNRSEFRARDDRSSRRMVAQQRSERRDNRGQARMISERRADAIRNRSEGMQRLGVSRRAEARSQRQNQAQRRLREVRREQSARQQQAQRQQQARRQQREARQQQAKREQREARRQQAVRQQQAQRRQQREARQQQARRQQQTQRRQQAYAQSQQRAQRQQQAQRQQSAQRQQQASMQRQQQARQSFAANERSGQGGQNRGNGHNNR